MKLFFKDVKYALLHVGLKVLLRTNTVKEGINEGVKPILLIQGSMVEQYSTRYFPIRQTNISRFHTITHIIIHPDEILNAQF